MMISDVVCTFCGCLCDDIQVKVENNEIVETRHACIIGHTKLVSHKEHRIKAPLVRKNGELKETSMDEAINRAAEILKNSHYPLLYGWSSTSCEAISKGVELAEYLGGAIDPTTSVCHGPTVLAVQAVGASGATLGEIRHRADLVIFWGCNPTQAHLRHMSRYSVFPRGIFVKRRKQRKIVVVDIRETTTSKLADDFIKINPGEDYELIDALRVAVNKGEIPYPEVGGVAREKIYELAETMKSARFGVIYFGMGLTMSRGKHRNIDNAVSLVRDLNNYTKFTITPMRGHYNVTGSGTTMAWLTGFPFAIDFSMGYARFNPGETASNDILQREECDSALIVASDPAAHFPKQAVKHLANIPVITITPHRNLTTEISEVIFPCAIAGIECEGTAYRMDAVPLRLRKIVNPPENCLPDEEILDMVLRRIKEGQQ